MRLSTLALPFENEYERWFLWVPVFFGLGIFIYFSLKNEPGWIIAISTTLFCAGLILVGAKSTFGLIISAILFWTCCGFVISKVRTAFVSAPTITKKIGVVTIDGWIEKLEKRNPRGKRVTIFVKNILNPRGKRLNKSKTPRKIRIMVYQKNVALVISKFTRFKAVLMPPPSPVWPGGFDYARQLWFLGIGAVGYSIARPETIETQPPPPLLIQVQNYITQLRERIKQRILKILPNQNGHLATALITGDRSGVEQKHLEALRNSGLAHILAISGLHMGMMAGTIYWLVRWILAAFPIIALNFPIKKVAAIIALIVSAYYLVISGAAISTQRSYIMISIMFLAVVLNRPAVTLRNVAMAALVILLIRPESLLDVGFQMSFAAVIALISIYETIARYREARKLEGQIPTPRFSLVTQYIAGISTTTIIASIAVAPFAIYHFHKLSQFGLLGNILAMPVVGLLIMPMVLLTLITIPFGLEGTFVKLMGLGIDLLTQISEYISQLPNAVRAVPQISELSMGLMIFGGLWLTLWIKQWRYCGLFPLAIGMALAPFMPFPDVLTDRNGKTIAAMGEDKRLYAPRARGGRFSLQRWLEIYGDERAAKQARKNKLFQCDKIGCIARVKNTTISYIRHPSALIEDCRMADIIISPIKINMFCANTLVIDQASLSKHGAHAIYINKKKIIVKTVQSYRSGRPWGS